LGIIYKEDMKNRIKKFTESLDNDNKFKEVIDEVKTLIESTIENSGGEFKSFIEKFEEQPKSVYIEGLINDSDVYDFYQTHRLVIDELLTKYDYFKKAPEEIGVYQYVIDSTKEAIELVVKMLAE
jgi:hypothetical protein